MSFTDSAKAPIGIFDSGVGGLTVLRALREQFPHERFLYLGDTARVPYGSKSPETVSRYSLNIAAHLVDEGCRAIVIACNTASAYAADAVRAAFDVPIVDVIQPMAMHVAALNPSRVLVLGTRGTVQSGAYPRALAAQRPTMDVAQCACPLFVPLAEEGWTHGPIPEQVVDTYLREAFDDGIPEAIILGCTHYPLLRSVIEARVQRLVPDRPIAIIDSGTPTSNALRGSLCDLHPPARDDVRGDIRYLVTDTPSAFAPLAERFLAEKVQNAEHVDILNRY